MPQTYDDLAKDYADCLAENARLRATIALYEAKMPPGEIEAPELSSEKCNCAGSKAGHDDGCPLSATFTPDKRRGE